MSFGLGLGTALIQSGGISSPLAISGNVLWNRADLGLHTATGISQWDDQSGTGDANKNFVQAVGGKQPTRNVADAAYNNQSTFSFASSGPQFMVSGTWAVPPPVATGTWFLVGNQDGSASQQAYLDGITAALLRLDNNNAGLGASQLRFFLSAAGLVAGGLTNSHPSIIAVQSVAGSASSALFVNALTAVATGNPGTSAPTGVVVGANVSGLVPLNGKIAELIAYNRILAANEMALVFAYLSTRYGITVGP